MANRLILVLAAALAIVPASVPAGLAQMRGAARPAPGYGTARRGASSFSHRRAGVPFGYFLGDSPYYFYDDYPYGQSAPESAPQFIVTQPPLATDTPPRPKASPLLIELEGDRYVRYGGAVQPSETDVRHAGPLREPRGADTARSSARQADAPSPALLAPTVLIYRDGSREQIPDYAIVGRILYAHSGNNAQPGYGMRSIEVSTLDIPATVTANRENGVKFVLPGGPNEVVTRP
jgi:hypothetical protein